MAMGGQQQHDASSMIMGGQRRGSTFSSCLERAIRRPVLPAPGNAADAAADTGGLALGVDGKGQDNIAKTNATKLEQEGSGEDWTSHHISYPLLLSTLTYFSQRRAGIRSRLVQLHQQTQRRDSSFTISSDSKNDSNTNTSNSKESSSSLICCCVGNGQDNKPQLSEEEFNLVVNEFANQAPFWKRDDDKEDGGGGGGEGGGGGSVSGDNNHLMEFAEQRALGRTPPGGRSRRKTIMKKSDSTHNFVAAVESDGALKNTSSTEDDGGISGSSSPYLRMGGEGGGNDSSLNTNNDIMQTTTMLDETEITKRLSYIERSELSAILDSESERAATFYRSRISLLAPPRIDGGTCPSLFAACGDFEMMPYHDCARAEGSMAAVAATTAGGNNGQDGDNEDDELVAPSQEREHFSFTDMASEILELHAFITTNIIVVRQVLIKYDAFVRSLGGTPMGSWYQTTRRQRVNGRSSDYLDLVNHSKLTTLTRAYIHEYERHQLEDDNEEDSTFNIDDYVESGLNGTMREQSKRNKRGGKRRLTNLSRAFYKILDASEEIKRRQRLKWRQSAMHIGVDDVDYFAPEETMDLVDAGSSAAPGAGMSEVSTPMPSNVSAVGNSSPVENITESTPFATDTPTPNPPLHPVPDYSTLKKNYDLGEDIAYQVHIFKCVQSKTERSIEKTFGGRISGARDNFIYTLREYFLLGSVSDNLSLMPEYLVMRGKSLKSSLLVVAQWREARDAYRYGLTQGGTSRDSMSGEQWFGGFFGDGHQTPTQPSSSARESFALFLNISACFLYMMNYYIVMPSSIQYANALGAEDAMSGLIIGATPTAAIISAIVFSIWSNRTYRAPLLTSGVLLIVGNILYASAYRSQSIAMVLCGRFLTGLGGPRSMNRRYIADTTPLAHRTAANAAFGMATAMGAALGPAAAILLDRIDMQFTLPLYGSVYVNGISGPGYLMGMLWSVYTLVMALMFVEPQRSGLQEQIRNELLQSMTGSATKVRESHNDSSQRLEVEMSKLEAPNSRIDESYSFSTENGQGNNIIDNTDPCDNTISKTDASSDTIVDPLPSTLWQQAKFLSTHLTFPVRICLVLLFTKMFTAECVISSASIVTKNRYLWAVQQVGTLGTIVGCLTIPISVFIGWASQYREDRVLMLWLMTFATFGMGLLIDVSDFVSAENETYNEGNALAVGSRRYIAGYLLVFCSVQAFDGLVGSMLSKVIPTALATGTLNSGLLATVVGTFGRACGDIFITSVGYISLRQIMNLLFVPSFLILASDLVLLICYYDSLTA